jgi:tetratricopeptide (TPR) repeat protein
MRRVVETPAAVVEILKAVRVRADLAELMDMSRAVVLLDDPATRSESCTQLLSIARTAADVNVRLNASKAVATAYHMDNRFEDALAAAKLGLAASPDDVMLNNNVASYLNDNLKKAEEARPYAEKAYAKAPTDLNVIDTMAGVLWAAGDRPKAVETAATVLRLRRSDADKAPLMLKLARWKLELGDKTGASALLDSLRETAAGTSTLSKDLKNKIEQLRTDIEAAH